MCYPWQFMIMFMDDGKGIKEPIKHEAERYYCVRQQIGKDLSTRLTLTEALDKSYVPEEVKYDIRTIMNCYKYN